MKKYLAAALLALIGASPLLAKEKVRHSEPFGKHPVVKHHVDHPPKKHR
jgi:hypothetical protein